MKHKIPTGKILCNDKLTDLGRVKEKKTLACSFLGRGYE
jgi:hypothetical protein